MLSKNEFKALSSDTRTTILKILDERNHTLSELSIKTEMSAPTIKQHTKILIDSGLIELKDEGRKWKYYCLTKKGKELLNSNENKTNILIILSSTIVVLLGFALILSTMLAPLGTQADMSGIQPMLSANDFGEKANISEAGATQEITRKVKCMPIFESDAIGSIDSQMNESQINAIYCYQSKSKEECEQTDIYNEETKKHNEPDGKPDCKWQE